MLLKAGANPSLADQDNITPLHLAAKADAGDVVEHIVTADNSNLLVSIEPRAQRATPLLLACNQRAVSMGTLRALLQPGAETNQCRDSDDNMPLHFA